MSLQTLEVRFVSDAPEAEQDRDAFIAAAIAQFERTLNFDFRQVEAIPPQPSGKLFEYVCELPEP